VGRANAAPVRGFDAAAGRVLTPDDLLDGLTAQSPIVVFDDDHYYLGSVLSEKLRASGHDVTIVTPADRVAAWTVNTLEQHAIQRRLLELGVRLGDEVVTECTYTACRSTIPASSVVTITSRLPNDELYEALTVQPDALSAAGIVSVNAIGDCLAPGTIAAAVYAGHRYGREFDLPENDHVGFRREMPQ
jgi:dimethylamine/trimethylamine dehydrogenase